MPKPHSYSSLSMYERCPRQYAFRYIEKAEIPELPLDWRMHAGSVVHAALEFIYLKSSKNKKVELEKIVEELQRKWDEAIALSSVPVTPEELLPFVQQSVKNVEYYYQHHFLPETEATLGVEHKVMLPLFPQRKQWLIGFLDRVSSPEESVITIHDYKTGKQTLTNKTLLQDFQATLYGGMAAHEFGKEMPLKKIELKWHYLSHEKTVSAILTPDASRSAIQKAQNLSTRIGYSSQTGLFPAQEGAHCSYCDFSTICPAKKKSN
ncbi:MAG: PD-(D/E)XK nuclease family protein [Candidatus Iainarchaeum archaeon]|uniref:PD-(D/E)XK nuclease family protein n=1 Tax=Candidatus Iainarchaeum sp. TaxID=3101447 RepID=A0A7T9DIY8_9ARCH|nr:MAG: PD-(D/E)XK nuclease family protein [Candidatus Diapherotrites archaeon]